MNTKMDRRGLLLRGALLAGAGLMSPRPARAAGELDATFSGDGKIIVPPSVLAPEVGADALAVAVSTDGKVLVAGSVGRTATLKQLLVRYNADGSPDAGFGNNGVLISPPTQGGYRSAYGAAVQDDGKIVVAGYDGGDFFVSRYLSNGAADNGFGPERNGTVRVGRGGAYAVTLLPGGGILAGGYLRDAQSANKSAVLAQLLPSGDLNTFFDSDGIARGHRGHSERGIRALTVSPNGTFYATEQRAISMSSPGALLWYNVDGTLRKSHDLSVYGAAVAATANRAYVTGFGTLVDIYDLQLKRVYHKTLPTFYGNAAVVDANGRVVIAGQYRSKLAIARLLPDGQLDTSFAGDGIQEIDFGGRFSRANAAAIGPDGKIVAAGHRSAGGSSDPNEAIVGRVNP